MPCSPKFPWLSASLAVKQRISYLKAWPRVRSSPGAVQDRVTNSELVEEFAVVGDTVLAFDGSSVEADLWVEKRKIQDDVRFQQ